MSALSDLWGRVVPVATLLAFGLFLWHWPVWQVALLAAASAVVGFVATRTRFVMPTWAGVGLALVVLIAALVVVGVVLL